MIGEIQFGLLIIEVFRNLSLNSFILTPFAFAARIIMNFPATTSNLDRSHKINKNIHTIERNRFTNENVKNLTSGKIALSNQYKYNNNNNNNNASTKEFKIIWNTLESSNFTFDEIFDAFDIDEQK